MTGYRHRLWIALIGLLGSWGLFVRPALALKYRPRADETLSHVALIHYGDVRKSVYLVAANGILEPDKSLRGKILWVPTVWKYRLKKGDSLAKISTKYLRDAKRSDFLVWLNRIQDPKDVKIGTWITIPFLLPHRAQKGESLVDVARRYYFQSKPTGLLRKFNGKRTNALNPGEVIWVPIYDREAFNERVVARATYYQEREGKVASATPAPAGPDSQPVKTNGTPVPPLVPVEAAKLPEGPEEPDPGDIDPEPPPGTTEPPVAAAVDSKITPAEEAAVIQKSFQLYRDGEYDLSRTNLEAVLERNKLSQVDEAEAREILAFCLVALDRSTEAEHEFVRLLMVAPERTLDPVTTSPKILEVFNRARGTH